jgi:hypothetical protein
MTTGVHKSDLNCNSPLSEVILLFNQEVNLTDTNILMKRITTLFNTGTCTVMMSWNWKTILAQMFYPDNPSFP